MAALALLAGTQTSYAIADPAVLGAQIQPAPAVYPNGGLEYFEFQINNNGTTTSSSFVTVTISLVKLDFDDGVFDPAVDIEQVTGTTPFTWSWDASIKTMTGTLSGSFGQFTGNTFRIKNLKVLAAASMGVPNIGGNVNIVAPGPVNSSLTNDNTAAYTYSIAPLPVTLSDFKARKTSHCGTMLSWTVTDAVNFSHFELEHCKPGERFSLLKSIAYINDQASYSYSYEAGEGMHHYRLKMVDHDGRYSYSPIVEVRLSCDPASAGLLVYPSPMPSGSAYKVRYEGSETGTATIRVIDIAGRIVDQRQVELASGVNIFEMKSLASGSYKVELNNGKELRVWSSCVAL